MVEGNERFQDPTSRSGADSDRSTIEPPAPTNEYPSWTPSAWRILANPELGDAVVGQV